MISAAIQEKLAEILPKERILLKESMKNHNTFQVGGEADCLVLMEKEEEFQAIFKYINEIKLPYLILGNGSNLLISDSGFEGIVIKTKGSFDQVEVKGNRLIAQSGVMLSKLARIAYENGLTGLEFAAGIPGSVGGAVIMNAGAYGGEMSQVVVGVTVIDAKGNTIVLDHEKMDFKYRYSSIKDQTYVVSKVEFELKLGNQDEIKSCMQQFAEARRAKQPLEFPSAGSTFKRPEGYFAGKLIMDAGLGGYSIGGAQVSEKHCGFIINKGNATAKNISDLMDKVSEDVYKKFHVHLEPEVIKVGNF